MTNLKSSAKAVLNFATPSSIASWRQWPAMTVAAAGGTRPVKLRLLHVWVQGQG